MYFLTTFGGLALESGGQPLRPAAFQRRRLTLLVLLARGGQGGTSREKILGLLWPESSEADARHALDQLLYATRRDLGRDVVVAEAGQLHLNSDIVQSDCAQFEARLSEGDLDGAVTLYAGPFLEAVYLGDGAALEGWVESERRNLAEGYFQALERLACEAAERGDLESAVGWWRRRAAADPLSARVTLRLMEALAASGDRISAIRHARTYATLVRDELGTEPDPMIAARAETLAEGPEQWRDDEAAASPVPDSESVMVPGSGGVGTPADGLTASVHRGDPPVPVPTGDQHPGSRHPRWMSAVRARHRFAAIWLPAAVLFMLAAFWSQDARVPSAPVGGVRSVAVLPFEDLSQGGGAEYLGDGMSEELIHALAQLEDVKVVARTSAFVFKGEHTDVREIARALEVDAVLEGSVRQDDGDLRVTAQLIDAKSGYHLWSGSFDRRIGDALSIQHEIAEAIVATLRPHLAGGVRPPARSRTPDAAAYHLFLRGRYALHRRSESGLREAIGLFEQAIRVDPSYAAPYAALAEAYDALGDGGFASQDSSYRVAEAAAERAIQLDSTLAEGYASRGKLRFHRWDWAAAEQDFTRAIELNPGYAATYAYYAMPLVMSGRFDEGLEMIRKAQAMDPLALGTHGQSGWLLTLARRYDEAIDQSRMLLAMDSMRAAAHARLGIALVLDGESDPGIASLERAVELGGGYLRSSLPLLGYAYASAGRHTDAERVLRRVELELPTGSMNPYYAAALAGVLGHHDRAFRLLDETYRTSKGCLIDLGVDPLMDPLRGDARFPALARKLGMQPLVGGTVRSTMATM